MPAKQFMDTVSSPVRETKRTTGLTHGITFRSAVPIMVAPVPPIPLPMVVVITIRIGMIVPEMTVYRRRVEKGITAVNGTPGQGQENQK